MQLSALKHFRRAPINLPLGRLVFILHNSVNLLLLSLLHTDELLVHRILDTEPAQKRLLSLSKTIDSTKGLLLRRKVPPWIDDNNPRCHGKVEAHYVYSQYLNKT